MASVKITVDDELLRRARARAASAGTSVADVLRTALEKWTVTAEDREAAVASVLARSRQARPAQGRQRWSRDDLHDRTALRAGPARRRG